MARRGTVPLLHAMTGVISPRMAAAKRNGREGGHARAKKYSQDQRRVWGEKAGAATLAKYGHDYFKYIRSLSKRHPVKKG